MACVFCEKQDFIYENKYVKVFYDAYPVNEGHVLIVTQRHIPEYFSTTPEEARAIDEAIKTMKNRIEKNNGPDGYTIGINNGGAAGQTVFHLHVHLIPRYKGDVANPSGGVRGVLPHKQHY